jgi:hypothetical protein
MKKSIIKTLAAGMLVAALGLSYFTTNASDECKNGCLDNGNGCACNGWWPCYQEAASNSN